SLADCGSWLACDEFNSVCLIHQGVCIAGKPAPTEKQTCAVRPIFFRIQWLFSPHQRSTSFKHL
ncbi:hypothetical protein JWR97_21100, partial [Pseudomonas cedrina subsp. fulgida]|nr:hypothetical protein [Pseudomonas cedrina subsp. fulgida]